MTSLLITNARIVNEGREFEGDLRVRGDRIQLFTVDSKRAARLVIDGKLDGTVDKTRNGLRVYVRGDRSRMLGMVREHAIFEDKPTLELVRSKLGVDAFERSLRRPPATRGQSR